MLVASQSNPSYKPSPEVAQVDWMNQCLWRMECSPSLSVISRGHGVGQILLVREHEQHGVAQLILVQHAVQLVPSLRHAVSVVGIHDEDQTLGVLEVVPPQRGESVCRAERRRDERGREGQDAVFREKKKKNS